MKKTFQIPGLLGFAGIWIMFQCAGPSSPTESKPVYQQLEPAEAYTLILTETENPDFTIMDIRTEAEFLQGHIAGAGLMDYYDESFETDLGNLDRTKHCLIYCRSGNRSQIAFEMMQTMEFLWVSNLLGGIQRWIDEGFPVVIPGGTSG